MDISVIRMTATNYGLARILSAISLAVPLSCLGFSPATASPNDRHQTLIANQLNLRKTPEASSPATNEVSVTPLTEKEQEKLLNTRLSGGLGNTFERFANMFVVMSSLNLDCLVGLATDSEQIEKQGLTNIYPETYKPTLRELLDVIAKQTCSAWHYDPTGKFIRSDQKNEKPLEHVAIFAFEKADRKKPYEVTLAKEWKVREDCSRRLFVPPSAPYGMDVYEVGSYSTDDQGKENEFLQSVPTQIALDWAKRVKPSATKDELKNAKVGEYDAVFFEDDIKSKLDKPVHWRHWAFLVGNKGYLIISTIFPDKESIIYPDVQEMLKSFREISVAGDVAK